MPDPQYRYSSAVPFMLPSVFAKRVLGLNLYPIQCKVVDSLAAPDTKTTFAACNNAGKTGLCITTLILWHLSLWPKGKIISTSGSFNQITLQLQNALVRYRDIFEDVLDFYQCLIKTKEGGFWSGFSTNDPGKAEGHHAFGAERPLMIIVDEAKTVPDNIFEALARCSDTDTPTRVLYASSPGFAEGAFFRSHSSKSTKFTKIWQHAEDTPHISAQQIKDLRAEWVGFPAFADSMLGHAFMPMVEDAVISMRDLDYCMANPPEWRPGVARAFCDFAFSTDGDENVLAVCNGNRITLEACFHADNLNDICDRFVQEFRRLDLKPGNISGDEGGGGKMVCDELDNRGYCINRVNNGSPATDSEHYVTYAAEVWYEASKKINSRSVILPDDISMRGQALSRKRIKGSQGRLNIESKRDMKARGVTSPDRFETVVNAIAPIGGFTPGSGIFNIKAMGIGSYTAVGG